MTQKQSFFIRFKILSWYLPGRAKESQNKPETWQSLLWSITSLATLQYKSSISEPELTRCIPYVAETLINQIVDYEKHICLSKHVLKEINNISKALKSKAVITSKKKKISHTDKQRGQIASETF